jgi:(p)ppGpp synthase/HD superfamily hydrolase
LQFYARQIRRHGGTFTSDGRGSRKKLVAEATGGTDPDAVIAALLHDAIEDQDITSKVLASEFGQQRCRYCFGGE